MIRITCGVAGLLTLVAFGRGEAQQKVDVGHAATPDVSVRLMGGFTKLRIVGWKSDSISVTGTLPKGARLESYLGDNTATPTRGAKMFIEQADDHAPPGGVLELRVPMRARVWIKGGNADVDASGVTGELDINMLGGSVRVNGKPRLLSVETIDASVSFDGIADWVRLKTAEGDIAMRGGSADAAFTTVSGNVRVSDGTFERARFETVSGGVTFAADLLRSTSIVIDTHSGPIDVQLAPKAGADIDAITSSGTIDNLLTGKPAVAGRDARGQEIGLTLGDGRIVIRTYKGNIRLARR